MLRQFSVLACLSALLISCASTSPIKSPSGPGRPAIDEVLRDSYVKIFKSVALGNAPSFFHSGLELEKLRDSIPETRMDRVRDNLEFYSALFETNQFSPMISANFTFVRDVGLSEIEFFSDQIEPDPDGEIVKQIFFETIKEISKALGTADIENRLIDTRTSTSGRSWMDVSATNYRVLNAKWTNVPPGTNVSSVYFTFETASPKLGYFRMVVHY